MNVRGYSQSQKMGIIPPCFWVAILIVFNWETKEKCLIINKKFDNIDLATGNQDFLCYYQTEWVLPTPIPFLICSFANRFDNKLIFHCLKHGNRIKRVNLSKWFFTINNGNDYIVSIIIIPEFIPMV